MKIMIIGDICGRPGRQTAAQLIPSLKREYDVDFIIANGENSAAGVGITKSVFDQLKGMDIDVITTGNHVWDKKEVLDFINSEESLIRPANYPSGTPGRGYHIISTPDCKIGIINLIGRVFMPALDCPFRAADKIIAEIETQCDIIIIDFHAETTAEKIALGWYLDGRVSCIVGTHTHVQTADERVLPQGTAYITDLGMVGPYNSVLGVDKDIIIKKFLTGLPAKFNLASGDNIFCAVLVDIDEHSGKALSINRIQRYLPVKNS